ncbi:hypothetical protein FB567DRAFT_619493 [Paraphoma chrysanthemicola]|uniref:Uncharacterized protein n=1 Tax=Paraphoma chrysanthemicola TaxID=798071 RepID=A0A8K0R9U3_9PLEO|nr:hypothetical protein FB567DRAFT_619493 [Paraphoma chrysanthemicola]
MPLTATEKQAVIDLICDLQLFIPDHRKLMEKLLVPIAIAAVEHGKEKLLETVQSMEKPSIDKLKAAARDLAAGKDAKAMLERFEEQNQFLEKMETMLARIMDNNDKLSKDNARERFGGIQTKMLRTCQTYCKELFGSFKEVSVGDEVDEIVENYPVLQAYLDDDLGDEKKLIGTLRSWNVSNR